MVWMVIPTKSQHINVWSECTFVFGTETEASPTNSEGWLVGVWDGNSWDPSHRLQTWSHQNPTRRCCTKLPNAIFPHSCAIVCILNASNFTHGHSKVTEKAQNGGSIIWAMPKSTRFFLGGLPQVLPLRADFSLLYFYARCPAFDKILAGKHRICTKLGTDAQLWGKMHSSELVRIPRPHLDSIL